MPLSDRVLMGPGPCNPYPDAVEALARPMVGHLDPEFVGILDETCDRLRAVFRTSNPMTLPISGTGSAGMEAAFVNLVVPGEVVVIGVNGVFGARMCDVASRCGAEVVRVDVPWGQPVDPERLLAAHPSPAVIAVVHAETSTGVRSDIAPLGEGKGDALLLVDCVTILDEGLDAAIARHTECGRLLHAGLGDLGLELFVGHEHRLPELTTVLVPEGVDDAKVRAALLDRYGIEIGGGLGDYAGKMWRIGCMGHTARPRNVTLLLGALGEVLD